MLNIYYYYLFAMCLNKRLQFFVLLCRVSSSEKIDKENRYCEFKIVQLPYPGNSQSF